MTFLGIVVLTAALLCSLVAGFLFAFAIVVMPGIANLDDRNFIRAFQVIDRVIQNNQPVFMLVWVGSTLALLAAAVVVRQKCIWSEDPRFHIDRERFLRTGTPDAGARNVVLHGCRRRLNARLLTGFIWFAKALIEQGFRSDLFLAKDSLCA